MRKNRMSIFEILFWIGIFLAFFSIFVSDVYDGLLFIAITLLLLSTLPIIPIPYHKKLKVKKNKGFRFRFDKLTKFMLMGVLFFAILYYITMNYFYRQILNNLPVYFFILIILAVLILFFKYVKRMKKKGFKKRIKLKKRALKKPKKKIFKNIKEQILNKIKKILLKRTKKLKKPKKRIHFFRKKTEYKRNINLIKILNEIKIKNKYKTDIDLLYELIQRAGRVSILDVASTFHISREKAEEWAKILEGHDLIILHYPALGEAELCKK